MKNLPSDTPAANENLWWADKADKAGSRVEAKYSGGMDSAAAMDGESSDACTYDCNIYCLTQQTDTGAGDDCLAGTVIEYTADTLPANSGSPIMREANAMANAIHTIGGCGSIWSDYGNAGTWLGYGPPQVAL